LARSRRIPFAFIVLQLVFSNVLWASSKVSLSETADSLLSQGKEILKTSGDITKAKKLYTEAKIIGQQLNDKVLIFRAQLGEAVISYQSGHYQASYNFADSILQLIPPSEEALIAQYRKLNGNNLVYLGNYPKAYDNQLKALEYFQKIKDNKNLASLHFSIGNNFFYQSHFELALEHFEKSSTIWKAEKDTKGIFWAVGAIGSVYEHQGKMKEAISYSEEALSMAYELDSKPDIAWTLYNLGSILTTNGEIQKGLKQITEANEIAIEIKDYPLIGYTLEGLSKIHVFIKEYDKAIQFLDKSHEIAKENNELATMPNIYRLYSEIYYLQNDLQQFKKYSDKQIAIKDSLNNEQLTKAMGSLKKDFEVRELERKKEIALLKKDARIDTFKKLIFMGSVSFAAFVLLLISIFASKNNRLQKEKNQLLLSSNKKILEQVEQLKSSNRDLKEYANIISHDLKEPLRNIGSFTTLLKRSIGSDISQASSDYMQFIQNGVKQLHTLLIDLKNYSEIDNFNEISQTTNCNKVVEKLVASFNFNPQFEKADITFNNLPECAILPKHFELIISNLISNGIKFNQSEKPKIFIDCDSNQNEFVFSVKDNGIGIDQNFKEKIFVVFQRLNNREQFSGSGIGLASCKKIINNYGGRIWFTSDIPNGSTFFFTIPKNTSNSNSFENSNRQIEIIS